MPLWCLESWTIHLGLWCLTTWGGCASTEIIVVDLSGRFWDHMKTSYQQNKHGPNLYWSRTHVVPDPKFKQNAQCNLHPLLLATSICDKLRLQKEKTWIIMDNHHNPEYSGAPTSGTRVSKICCILLWELRLVLSATKSLFSLKLQELEHGFNMTQLQVQTVQTHWIFVRVSWRHVMSMFASLQYTCSHLPPCPNVGVKRPDARDHCRVCRAWVAWSPGDWKFWNWESWKKRTLLGSLATEVES